jgi:predicted amidohydrolase YtcJ
VATVFHGGPIVTMAEDASGPAPEAVAVRDGRVAAVGSLDDVTAAAGAGARSVDLAGATLMPGLVDTHPHLLHWAAFTHAVVPLFDAKNYHDIVEKIRAAAASTPKGEWIRCSPIGEPHYFNRRSYRDLEEGELPTRELLDFAAPDHPVWIQAWAPVTPNITVFNTRGLRQIQLSRNSPDRIGRVAVEKDEQGEPTGRLQGPVNNYYNNEPWWDSVLARIYTLTGEDFVVGALEGMADANQRGVTTVFEGHIMDWPLIDVYRLHRQNDALTVRVLCTPDGEPHGLPTSVELTFDELGERLQTAHDARSVDDDLLRIDSFLCTRGGPVNPGMMIWHRKYRGPFGEWTNGLEFLPPEKGRFMVEFAAERGMRMNLIAVADREHDIALEHLEAARAKFGDFSDKRWILQHAYFMNDEHCRRYADLGFDITTSMSFSYFKQHTFRERIGNDVLKDLIPLRRELDHGFTVGCGTDWGPANIFEHVALAETHAAVGGGRNDTPGHSVTRPEALAMWTTSAAKILQWDGIGSIAPGPSRRPHRGRQESSDHGERGPARHEGPRDPARRPRGPRRRGAVT